MPGLPTGTVTFLFTDIEGSTELLQRLGDRRYAEILAEHRRLLREAFAEGNGQEIDTQGDAFLVAFSRARDAVGTAVAAQRALAKHAWPDGASLQVRMGLHTGEPISETGGYVGLDLHRASRICSAGHGGQILLSDAVSGLAARDLPPGVSVRDLGSHRLKDLREPEHLLQVVHPDLPADFPSLKSLDARPNNLPIQLTSFIGRGREIAEVKRLIGAARLVTLTGSGGAGKTRLALQVAADVVESFPDGVWLAEFAPIADPALVPKTVASALNVHEQPGHAIIDTLIDALRPKALLLVLDNCEHLLAACADFAAALLRACPQVRILATSREGLGVPGETLWRVPSLSLPDIRHLPATEDLVLYEAVRLFVDRAVSSVPGFTVTRENAVAVAQVCQHLDGIPLAIELAAARVKVLAVEQIAARLDDRFRLLTGGSRMTLPHHQTLRAAMDWSHALLSEKEEALFRRLSVFAGGWTLEAAEAICGGEGIEASDVLDLLTHLVDKSLVVAETRKGEARYGLLETVRQYGLGRLLESGEAETLRRRHLDHYLELAERAEPEIQGPDQLNWLDRLETEHDNLRAALEWSERAQDNAEVGLQLASALWWFWQVRGYLSEGRRWLEGTLAASADQSGRSRTIALPRAGFFAWTQGDYQRAFALCDESLRRSRDLGDRGSEALSLLVLGFVAKPPEQAIALLEESLRSFRGAGNIWGTALSLFNLAVYVALRNDYPRVKALLEESLRLFREVGDKWGTAFALNNLGRVMLDLGDSARAKPLLEESLALRAELRDRWGIADTQNTLGMLARYQGDYARATALHEDSVAIFKDLGGKRRLAQSLRWLALVAHDQGDSDRTTALLEESLSISKDLGLENLLASTVGDLGLVAKRKGDTRRAKSLLGESLRLLRATRDESRIAWCFERLAGLAETEVEPERAAHLLGAAERLRETIGVPVAPPSRGDYQRTVATVRERLGEPAFTRIWAEGRAMTLEQAIEYALRDEN